MCRLVRNILIRKFWPNEKYHDIRNTFFKKRYTFMLTFELYAETYVSVILTFSLHFISRAFQLLGALIAYYILFILNKYTGWVITESATRPTDNDSKLEEKSSTFRNIKWLCNTCLYKANWQKTYEKNWECWGNRWRRSSSRCGWDNLRCGGWRYEEE